MLVLYEVARCAPAGAESGPSAAASAAALAESEPMAFRVESAQTLTLGALRSCFPGALFEMGLGSRDQ